MASSFELFSKMSIHVSGGPPGGHLGLVFRTSSNAFTAAVFDPPRLSCTLINQKTTMAGLA